MRHSGWWPDRVLRLFRRGRARFSDDLVHEQPHRARAPSARCPSCMLHESFASLEEVLDKMNRYSSAGAQMMVAEGRAGSLTSAVAHGVWTFMRTYLFKAGFMDGREGFMLVSVQRRGRVLPILEGGAAGEALMRIAVIVTTYNRPDALAAVLEGYAQQSDSGFGLIVADDGSTADTAELVQRFAARAPFEVSHVWQEDQGFRAAAIRNRAVAAARAEYIIFTDGDCVPSRTFVHQHRRLAEPGWFLSGNRVLLSERFHARGAGRASSHP